MDYGVFLKQLEKLEEACEKNEEDTARIMKEIVPSYSISDTLKKI